MKQFSFWVFLFSICLALPLKAQNDLSFENDSIQEEIIGLIPESLDSDIDRLLRSWHVQYFTKKEDYCHDDSENVFFPDSVYADRLARLPRIIPMPYNKIVRDCIDLYTERRRGLVRYMLGMADFYFPIIEKVLDKYQLLSLIHISEPTRRQARSRMPSSA